MYAKIEITGTIESITGMHIGGSSQFAAIGAVDSPVIRDVITDRPMIPGSTLKGKLRTLIARQYNDGLVSDPNEDDVRILRLFGGSQKSKTDGRIHSSRLIFSDSFMSNAEELKSQDVLPTEIKFENTINRLTAVANPRQIERSVRGGKYAVKIIYNVEKEDEIAEDFQTLADALQLLTYDYLGGNGSRGYGKVKFEDLSANCVIGNVPKDIMASCQEILKSI